MTKNQTNLDSEAARKVIADSITVALESNGVYKQHTEIELEEKEAKKSWVCQTCGKSTFETEYDYLVHPKLHLGCALEEELKGKDIKEQYHDASKSYFKEEKVIETNIHGDDDWATPSKEEVVSTEALHNKNEKYIYESPDGGETIYRRKFGDYNRTELKNKPSSTDLMFWKIEVESPHNDGWIQKHYQDKIDKYELTKGDTNSNED